MALGKKKIRTDLEMTTHHKRSPFPQAFWIANTMEIFERMAWYGFFTISSLYITGAVAEGGLGFTSEQRGTLQGIITFILYLLPVLTGALADRFGYKKTFILSYAIMVPAYYFLGQFTAYGTFFIAFLAVALGAAIFKPVVTGTVARTTDATNSSLGFGIFYMMVNFGGLTGTVLAGILRGWSWDYVFLASSAWIAVNFFWVLLFYKEPVTEVSGAKKRSLKQVLTGMVEVLGNLRFFAAVFVILVLLMVGSKGWLTWTETFAACGIWLGLNFAVDIPLRRAGSKAPMPPMKIGNWRFALYLLILSGFWTSFNQIFITMPEYIRDFVDTSDMLGSLGGIFQTISPIHVENIVRILGDNLPDVGAMLSSAQLNELLEALRSARIRVDAWQVEQLIEQSVAFGQPVTQAQLSAMAERLISMGRQVNPEYLIKFDAGSIVVFQILVSFIIARWRPFSAMVGGVIMASIGLGMAAFMHEGWPVVTAIVVFAFGEMMASPKSQEYIGRIAPADQKALYMGYYFWAVALGNLFGGLLSGQFYGWLARDLGRPDLMWMAFGGLGLLTAVALVAYDRLVIRKLSGGDIRMDGK
ncbi:MAG: MFS transporter [Candidatus Zixiibacteriota bacterium]|nr:MAG: MFS transporter [candidate division Zixibacteria bacterium]